MTGGAVYRFIDGLRDFGLFQGYNVVDFTLSEFRPFGRQNARLEHDLEGDRAIGRYVEFEIREGETLDPVRDFDTPVALDLPVILNHADRHRVSELGGELSAFRDSYIPQLICLAA